MQCKLQPPPTPAHPPAPPPPPPPVSPSPPTPPNPHSPHPHHPPPPFPQPHPPPHPPQPPPSHPHRPPPPPPIHPHPPTPPFLNLPLLLYIQITAVMVMCILSSLLAAIGIVMAIVLYIGSTLTVNEFRGYTAYQYKVSRLTAHYTDITWAAWRLKSQRIGLFVQQLV